MPWVCIIMEDVLAEGKAFLRYWQSEWGAREGARQRVEELAKLGINVTSVFIGQRVPVEDL